MAKRWFSPEASSQIAPEELIALRLLVADGQRTTVMPDIVDGLLRKGFVEREAGSLIVTSRGHAAIMDSKPPPEAA